MIFGARAPGLDPSRIAVSSVGALIVTEDRRYLMQLRTDAAHVAMRGHWGVFGGMIEPGETPEQALEREIAEELELTEVRADWFTELCYSVYQAGRPFARKYFYAVPVTAAQLAKLVLHEGEDMRLFDAASLFREPRIVPWDSMAILLHDRQETVFGAYRSYMASLSGG
jgi:8-oxo-dGTP pyrophosphatase MutT (NUDIX family)